MTRFLNQRGLLDEARIRDTSFAVIGAGAIGSFVVSTLAKMGARNITVYDDDSIEDHNIANQLYPVHYTGTPKVEALKDVAYAYGEAEIEPIKAKWTPETAKAAEIVISAVDNMDVRKAIWDFYKNQPSTRLFVDGRMAALVYRAYAVDNNNAGAKEYYESTLYPQSEAEPERCGHKSIIFTVLGVAHSMVSMIKQYLMNEYRPTELVADMHNHTLSKKYHMTPVYEVVDATADEPEEEEVMANAN